MSHHLDEIVHAQKQGQARGLPSICSAHPWVLKTALRGDSPVLVESTCNQVNQFGGYTGMTPADFVHFVRGIAAENGFPPENVLLGGYHLGPAPWQTGPTERAMQRAANMVQAYVQAGYTKLHLDTSMKLGDDDPSRPLGPELAARRTAFLAKVAEESLAKVPEPLQELRYVIGSEVPPPGGAVGRAADVRVTPVEEARRTLEVTHAAFVEAGLESAWERVAILVVQPGVEFGDDFVREYDPAAAAGLARFSEVTRFVYEAHSTDYQRPESLRALVRDHFAILKVGPALTFAFREAVFTLAMIESELFPPEERSRLIETLDAAMLREPAHWKRHYHGSQQQLALARKYSLSDRVRYYWPEPDVQAALSKLMGNLERAAPLPLALVSQYLPEMAADVRSGRLPNRAPAIITRKVQAVLDDYRAACG
jgi:D-tagatose-1,6-bisphosphate aldolase subunit GatZ/KbaZ